MSRLSDHAKLKIKGIWYVDPRFVPGAGLALSGVRDSKPSSPFHAAEWTPRSLARDAEIRRIVAAADDYAGELRRRGIGLTCSDKMFCERHGRGEYEVRFSPGTLRRWRKSIAAGESLPERRGRRRGTRRARIGAAAWNFFVATTLKLRLPLTESYELTRGKALQHDGDKAWQWRAHISTVRARFNREHPAFLRDWYLEGPDKWRAKHLPKIDRHPHDEPAFHTIEIDGTKANVLCRHMKRTVRPNVVMAVCTASDMVLGCAVALSESAELIRRVMWKVYSQYGAPKVIRFDQGKAFAGQGFSDIKTRKCKADQVIGLIKMMQAKPQDCTGRSGWQKGCVESMMRLIDKHDRLYDSAYIGNNTKSRHREADAYAKSHHDKLPTIAEYESTLRDFMAAENRRPRKQFDGLSPLQKFEQTRIPERRLPKQAEEFLRRRPQRVRVSNRGIGIRIAGKPVYFGQRDRNVWQRQGQRLVAYIDDDDLSNILVSDLDGRPLFYAENDGLIGIDTATLREAAKAQKRAAKLRREHFENVDFSIIPTVDVAVQLKRKGAEAEAAKLAATLEKRPIETTLLYPSHAGQMKKIVRRRRELRKAVGDDTSVNDGMDRESLIDIAEGLGTKRTDASCVEPLDLDWSRIGHRKESVDDIHSDLL